MPVIILQSGPVITMGLARYPYRATASDLNVSSVKQRILHLEV